MKVGEAFVEILGDNKKLNRSLKDSEKQTKKSVSKIDKEISKVGDSFKKVSSGIKKAGIGSSVILGFLGMFGKSAVDAASKAQELQNVINVSFGDMSKQINNWAKNTAESFSRSTTQITEYVGTAKSMLGSMVETDKQANEMSKTITELAIDLASFRDISDDRAFDALTGALTGEAEALKRLGFNTQQAALEQFAMQQGINKSVTEMSEAEKVTLRYQLILEKLSKIQGDAQRTSDSYANRVRALTSAKQELRVEIGKYLLPVATDLVGFLITGIQKFNNLDDAVKGNIVTVVSFATAGLVLTAGLGLLAFALETAITGMLSLGSIVGALTSPIFLGGLAIAAAATLAYSAWNKNWGGIRDKITSFAENIKNKFDDLSVTGVTIDLVGLIASLEEWLANKTGEIANWAKNLNNKIHESVKNAKPFDFSGLDFDFNIDTDKLKEFGKNIAKFFIEGFKIAFNLGEIIINLMAAVGNQINAQFQSIGLSMARAMKSGFEKHAPDWLKTGLNFVTNKISNITGKGGGKKGGHTSDFGFQSGGMTGNVGISTVAGVVHGGEWVMPAWMVDKFPSLVSMLEGMRSGKGFKKGGGVGFQAGGNIPNLSNMDFSSVQSFVTDIANSITGITEVLSKSMKTLSEIMINVADVIGEAFGVENLGQKIRDSINKLFGTDSGSKVIGPEQGAISPLNVGKLPNQIQQSSILQRIFSSLSETFSQGKIVIGSFFSNLASRIPGLSGAIDSYKKATLSAEDGGLGLSKTAGLASAALSLVADKSPEVQEAMDNVSEGLSSLIEPISKLLSMLGKELSGGLVGAGVGAMVAGPWGAVIGGIAGLIGGIFDDDEQEDAAEKQKEAAEAAEEAAERWQEVLDSDLDVQFESFQALLKGEERFQGLVESAEQRASMMGKTLEELTGGDLGNFEVEIDGMTFTGTYDEVTEEIQEHLEELREEIDRFLGTGVSQLQSNVRSAFDSDNVSDFISNVSQNLYSSIRGALIKAFLETSAIKDRLQDISDTIFQGIGSALADDEISSDEIEDIKDSVSDDVSDIAQESSTFYQILEELGLGMDNLNGTVNDVTESLTNVPSGFKIALTRFQVSQPDVALANGGIVTGPTNALVGEAGPEAVIPLEKMNSMGGETIVIQGDVYGYDDFKKKVNQARDEGERNKNIRNNGTPVNSTPSFAG